ncbi:BZ3500_MvSof-1268-A1-R1_Chr3-3g06384 [Microbotryum saponariae]|uniref:BZ3500_MvSof-1268-A1-R1_Chr3-3g06384 protein n=1 Tax=Microbotryum saponariae TaxID=289078 RepID=A0A2X0LBW4_9BASI|nr:BZ3500_MvSof-1268-A1-R1_Chr3-3g06384 [Microbotryum saponariae]SDA04351.1 BZ3501_MvSof-1269-A2-R1_Chr3-2g06071 [Microbotryum saponariae]
MRCIWQQKTFVALVARDFSCLITDYPWRSCYLTPFVPTSRPDILDLLDPNHGDAPRPSHGLLLTSMYADAFNRYTCSLYPVGDGTYIIHVFNFSTGRDGVVHGSRIDRSRFRGSDEDLPNEDLLRWHYRQCVLMNIRRWAVAEYAVSVSDKARRLGKKRRADAFAA